MAYSCQSVAILANRETADTEIVNTAYRLGIFNNQMALKTKMILMMIIGRFGQNIGIAFQLVDDWLDFVASADQLGDYHHCLSMMIIIYLSQENQLVAQISAWA